MFDNINQNSIIKFEGLQYNLENFKAKFCPEETEEAVINAWKVLVRKGQATVVLNKTKEQKKLEKISAEESFRAEAEEHEHFENQNLNYLAHKKREGRALYEKIEFDFANLLKAQSFQDEMTKALRIVESEIVLRPGLVIVVFYDVTDSEINSMSRRYKADKVISNTMTYAQKGAQGTADAIHYTATNFIAPTMQIGAKAGVNILKTLITTIAKTGSSFTTAAFQGAREAGKQIRYDPDVLKAGKELIDTKDTILRKAKSYTSNVGEGNGIRISQK